MDFRYGIHTIELFHRVSKKDFNKVFHSLKSIRISEETQGIRRSVQRKVADKVDFFGKILRNLAKTPCSDCSMGRGGKRGYGVVSKHSKRVPACGFCAVQVPCPNSQNCLLGRGSPVETSKRETL